MRCLVLNVCTSVHVVRSKIIACEWGYFAGAGSSYPGPSDTACDGQRKDAEKNNRLETSCMEDWSAEVKKGGCQSVCVDYDSDWSKMAMD